MRSTFQTYHDYHLLLVRLTSATDVAHFEYRDVCALASANISYSHLNVTDVQTHIRQALERAASFNQACVSSAECSSHVNCLKPHQIA